MSDEYLHDKKYEGPVYVDLNWIFRRSSNSKTNEMLGLSGCDCSQFIYPLSEVVWPGSIWPFAPASLRTRTSCCGKGISIPAFLNSSKIVK